METLEQYKENQYTLEYCKWEYKFYNHKVNNNFYYTFGKKGGGVNVNDGYASYALMLEAYIDENDVIKEIIYTKEMVSYSARPCSDGYLPLSRRDISEISKILSDCVIDESEEILNNIVNSLTLSDKYHLVKDLKTTLVLDKDGIEYRIKKKDLIDYINLSFSYNEIATDIYFWEVNNLNLDDFETFQYIYSLIDKKYYYCIDKLNKETERIKKGISSIVNYPKLVSAINELDYLKIKENIDALKHIEKEQIVNNLIDIILLRRNDLYDLLIPNVDTYYLNAIIRRFIESKDTDSLDIILSYDNHYTNYNSDDFIDNVACLKCLIKHNKDWPWYENHFELPPHFFELINIIGIDKVNFEAAANELLKLNRLDLLIEAIKVNRINDYELGQSILEKVQEIDNLDYFNVVYNYFKDELCEIKSKREFPQFMFNVINYSESKVNKAIIEKFGNNKNFLTIQLNDMIEKKKPIEEIKEFMRQKNFGINDYIITQTVEWSRLKFENGSPYIELLLEYYDLKYNINDLDLKRKANKICMAYIINNLLDDRFGGKFGLNDFLSNPFSTYDFDYNLNNNNLKYLEKKYKNLI